MERDPANALEAVFNLFYLARNTLDDRAVADTYLAMAEHELKVIARHPLFNPVGSHSEN